MATYYVHCIIKKPYHDDPYTSIQEYGVSTSPSDAYGTERWSQDKMIRILEGKEHVVKSLAREPTFDYAELEVVTRNGRKYVKSKNDGELPNNLLKLRDCGPEDKG